MKQVTQKQIVKAAKLFNKPNMVLPILESVCITPDQLTWNDLEVSVNIPFSTNVTGAISTRSFITTLETFTNPVFSHVENKIQISEGKQSIKVLPESIENFPVNLCHNLGMTQIGEMNELLLPVLTDAVDFTSDDDLRPAFQNVQAKTHIAATDCHRLMFVPLAEPLQDEILLPVKVIKLMDIFKGSWRILKHKGNRGEVINDEYVSIQFIEECAKFPDWKVVVPEVTEDSPNATFDTKDLRKAIKTGSKFGNQACKQAHIKLNVIAQYMTQDVDFETEYVTELNATYTDEIEIGFNWTMLDDILAKCGDKTTVNYWTPTKAVIFDGKYLLMPLLLR